MTAASTDQQVPQTGRSPEEYRSDLLSGRCAVSVWGMGYIGFSTFEALRAEKVRVVGYDISSERVAALRAAGAADTESPVGTPAATLTDDRAEALSPDVAVHFVAVPTERGARPHSRDLVDVLEAIVEATAARPKAHPPLVIVESTLTPGTVETLLLPLLRANGLSADRDLLLALAPRRDWFIAEGYGLRDLDRVYSGVGGRSAEAAYAVLSLMCDTLHRAPSHIEGELVKCVENAYRHLEITLGNQLTLAYPDVDMVEVLRLAGTKWNIGTFHPSFGTGGYCVPLGSRYLLAGTEHAEELTLLSQAVETDMRMRSVVADAVALRGPVVILGLAYKGDIKVSTLSPTVGISARLAQLGVPFGVFDPLYSAEEINRLLGADVAVSRLPEAIRAARAVLIVTDHAEFREEAYLGLLTEPREGELVVLDNQGVLAGRVWPEHVVYRQAGHPAWLRPRALGAETGTAAPSPLPGRPG
ncbi:UDP-N-acetyl-D-mannosaminuronic acid dehydrogenase [Streptomyces albus]|uniref:UDP-N-acetyl-D-mannosaminuronic acid dehydrogenase n=1 Tax=Streptomyces albus (strain ATCC 21838 / DSM 41398 / FERM P-419 / JCM 4703 / NBRC 107858) TaxID=1081613 RepID=A0A0B5ENM3_STRA4|nr:UDP-N-acetyl-D-mannosaminuronic acid dehydrogenase [Streptomyces albus]AOU75218.1 UDP-N-acetyl-D-mannosaminuronic acid dehydrogenase [Streptomyces albus]AYN31023.1 UDP-N-acetyl-D-galactosamine dehydrogenase [Streptomyces albus]